MFHKYVVLLLLGAHLVSSNIVKLTNFDESLLLQSADNDWWKTATIYQIYPKSFKDSNGDGIGDLNGILEKIDYIKGLGVQAIWLSPIFDSPQHDSGYDVKDYRKIWPTFGTLEDFKNLTEKAHQNGLKIIIDFVPNHTSDEHEWFIKSSENETTYQDYYIWKDCNIENGTRILPNNWRSVFGGKAWTYHPTRNQCYLHQFLSSQPDLNYRNPNVTKEMQDILKFWLKDNSVDGVRIDAVSFLVESKEFHDEAIKNGVKDDDTYEALNHTLTKDQPENFDIINSFRKLLTNISVDSKSKKIAFTEAEDIKYYGDGTNGFTFNFIFLDLTTTSTAEDIQNIIKNYLDKLYETSTDYIPNWVLGNHDTHRIASKVGKEKVNGLNMLTSFLPGIQVTFQGEELGMTNGEFDNSKGDDQKSNPNYTNVTRDFERTPFQWSDAINAGFTDGNHTWLPVAKGYEKINVEVENNSNSSNLNIYRQAQKWRTQTKNNIKSSVEIVSTSAKWVLHLTRTSDNTEYHYLFNINNTQSKITLKTEKKINVEVTSSDKKMKSSSNTLNNTFTLEAYESIILSYEKNVNGAPMITFSYILLFALSFIIRL